MHLPRVWLLSVAVLATACSDPKPAGQAALEGWLGKNLAGVVVQTLAGQPQPLKDVAGGQPVLVNVWATWCPPCIQELPSLAALAKQGGYTVVAIATDADAKTVKDYLRKQPFGPELQVWWDPLGQVTREAMGATGLPSTLLLDASLTVKLVAAGERSWNHPEMLTKMQAALR